MKATVTPFPRPLCGKPTCTFNKCWNTRPAAVQRLSRPSKLQRELVAQDVVAIDPVDRRLALPTLAAQFALDCRLALRHSSGQRQAQIKIAPHTLIVRTGEAEQCLGVRKIESALGFALRSPAKRPKVGEECAERL